METQLTTTTGPSGPSGDPLKRERFRFSIPEVWLQTAITEPNRLLNRYRAHLNENGGILLHSIPHLVELMKSTSGKLVPKCISLCIIASSLPDVQSKLCREGVWEILLKWLQEALKEDNYPFLMELLKVYQLLPVRLEQLMQNVCAKLINSLTKRCKDEDSEAPKRKADNGAKPEDTLQDSSLEKKRRRTVKVPPTVMRTAGVEDNAQIQPKSRSEVLAKKSKLDGQKPSTELPIESFHQRITVTPTGPRKVNVNRVSLDEIRHKDLSLERQVFRKNSDDRLISSQKWRAPLPLDRVLLAEPGFKSTQRKIQTEREHYVLQAIYFTHESIPPTPEEPDAETVEPTAVLEIPLEDLTVSEARNGPDAQFNADQLLLVKDNMGSNQMSLNPEVADLVKSLADNLSSATPSDRTIPTTILTTTSLVPALNPPPLYSHPAQEPLPAPIPNILPNDPKPVAPNQNLQRELWEVLEENYPDINVADLNAERIRELLDPLRDQLVARGIFQRPPAERLPTPIVDQFVHPPNSQGGPSPPTLRHSGPQPPPGPPTLPPPPMHYGPQSAFPGPSPPPHPLHCGPPPDFRPPLTGGFCPPPVPPPPFRSPLSQPPPLSQPQSSAPPPPQQPFPPGPMRGPGSSWSAQQHPSSFVRGGVRGKQPCKFFQQGHCRHGAGCTFLHTQR